MNSKTIVFVHGLFVNAQSWLDWKIYFEAQGFNCHLFSYPFHEGEVAQLKRQPAAGLASLTFGQVLSQLSDFIKTLPEKPILIGHSMGGLLVQKLISQEQGLMGICINSAPPKGIFVFNWGFIKTNFAVINPFKGSSIFQPSLKWFHSAFCHTLDIKTVEQVFEKLVVPESRNIPRSSSGKEGFIDFKKAHQPLLFIAGELDVIVPASLNKKNFGAYQHKQSSKEFKLFAGRTHFICGQDGWQEVADYCLKWIHSQNNL